MFFWFVSFGVCDIRLKSKLWCWIGVFCKVWSVFEVEFLKFDECVFSKIDLRLYEGVIDIFFVIKVLEGKFL